MQYLGGTFGFQVHSYGHNNTVYGVLLAINSALIILIELPIVARLQRVPTVKVIMYGCLLGGLSFGLIPIWGAIGWLALAMVILTISEIMTAPFMLALTAEMAPSHLLGRYQGLVVMVEGFSLMVGPVIGAAVFSVSQTGVWVMCLSLGLVAGGLMVLVTRRRAAENSLATSEAEFGGS
jgi:MFS family permease